MKGPALTLAAALALALASAPVPAAAGSGDAAATQAYIEANYMLVQAARSKLGSSEAALEGLLRRIRSECPGAAAESPQNHDSEQLTDEVVLAMRVAATHPDLQAIAAFIRAVDGLRWSNHELTRAIQSYAGNLKALSKLQAPDLCADLSTWRLSGFTTLPAITIRLDRRFEALNAALGELPARLLAPYERPSEQAILRRTMQLELQLTDGETRAVEPWGQIMEALDLSP